MGRQYALLFIAFLVRVSRLALFFGLLCTFSISLLSLRLLSKFLYFLSLSERLLRCVVQLENGFPREISIKVQCKRLLRVNVVGVFKFLCC